MGWIIGGLPLALERVNLVVGFSDPFLYVLPKPDLTGRTALRPSALEFLARLATIRPLPEVHRHRYHGVFPPNARLRPLVTARAQEENVLAAQVSRSDVPLPAAPAVSPCTPGLLPHIPSESR